MSDTKQVGLPLEESLRSHVLAPLATADSTLSQEYEEVDAERRAFDRFKNRIAIIKAVVTASAVPVTRAPLREQRSRAPERVRSAYRETVMDVDHYDDFYGETLIEHVTAELTDEIAAGLQCWQ